MRRGTLLAALVVYGLFLAVVLLAPTSTAQSEGASWLVHGSDVLGLPDGLATQPRAEFLANALILMPASALGSLAWPRTTWRAWVAYGFLFSGLVELAQGLLLPERTASHADVVANTLGALGGAVFGALVTALVRSPAREGRQELD